MRAEHVPVLLIGQLIDLLIRTLETSQMSIKSALLV
jgi:hypothetical protein